MNSNEIDTVIDVFSKSFKEDKKGFISSSFGVTGIMLICLALVYLI